jgi:hypothetical protein
MSVFTKTLASLAVTLALASTTTTASTTTASTVSSPDDRQRLNLTLYQGGFGLIQDERALSLSQGVQSIEFQGVSPGFVADSALLEGAGIKVLERNYTYDLISLEALLKAHVGQALELRVNSRLAGEGHGEEHLVDATLITVRGGAMVLKASLDDEIGERLLVLPIDQFGDMIVFTEIPLNLSESPTLRMTLASEAPGDLPVTLTYLAEGFDWQASYVASLVTDSTLNLDAWVTLDNRTELAMDDANVQLMAGQINRAREKFNQPMMARAMVDEVSYGAQPEMEAVGDYKLYTLPRPVDLSAMQKKQVSLFEANGVAIQKRYEAALQISQPVQQRKAKVLIELENVEARGLGLPMPAGVMRFYEADKQGRKQFVGEARLPDLDRHEAFQAPIGDAFGVSVTNKILEHDSQRGLYRGELILVNSQDRGVQLELILQPELTVRHGRAERQSLCRDGGLGGGASLGLALDPMGESEIHIVAVEEVSGQRCQVSLRLPADSRSQVSYRSGW